MAKRRRANESSEPTSVWRRAAPRAEHLTKTQRERLALLLGNRVSAVVIITVSSVTAALCEAGLLAIAARAATSLVHGGSSLSGSLGPLSLNVTVRQLLVIGCGMAVLRAILQVPLAYYPANIAGNVQSAMRQSLMHAYSRASWEIQSQDREGHFQELMTNQVQQASSAALQATSLLTAVSTFAILVLAAFALNALAACAVFGAAIVLFGVLRPANRLTTRLSRRLSAAQLAYAGSVGEANRMSEETNVFGVADSQSERVSHFVRTASELLIKVQIVVRLIPNMYQSFIYLALVAGLLAVSEARVSGISSLGAVVLISVRAGSYGQTVQSVWVSLRQSLPFVERVQQAIDSYRQGADSRGDLAISSIRTLGFDGVEYAYRAGRPVLKRMSFQIDGGETIGVVGPSGAGKSTMVQLLLRLREPGAGRYLVNGETASRIAFDDWHERVAYVPQAPKLLHASVADNVRFYRKFDDAAVERACRLARIHDDIVTWPKGYETIVGPRADAVSGGQQQRICLARALVSEPSLLVLDEPTSALDPTSEALIQESLEALQNELTLIIIAHRMSTLSICDRVMVVLDGTLDAFDTLAALTADNEYYRHASGLTARALGNGAEAESLLGGVQSASAEPVDSARPAAADTARRRTILSRWHSPGR